jgi:hypothetical protein
MNVPYFLDTTCPIDFDVDVVVIVVVDIDVRMSTLA